MSRINGINYEMRAQLIHEKIEARIERMHFTPSRNRRWLVPGVIDKLREEGTGESYHEAKELWKLYSMQYPDDMKGLKDPTKPRWGWPDCLGPLSH